MIEELKSIKSAKSDLRSFGITIGIILMLFAGYAFWRGNESFQLVLAIGIILFVFGITIPLLLKPVYLVWMMFATILGWFMTRVILSILFYVILTPIGVVSRLFGKQFLEVRWDKSESSYWNYRSKIFDRESHEKQF